MGPKEQGRVAIKYIIHDIISKSTAYEILASKLLSEALFLRNFAKDSTWPITSY